MNNLFTVYNFPREHCVFQDEEKGVLIYQLNCLELMDILIKKYPNGIFDMIFADPPYFLSNGGITCHAGKMTKVDKVSPLYDQVHIANILSKDENLITQRKESIYLLDDFFKSTFLEMFGYTLVNSKQWKKIKIKDCGRIVIERIPPSNKDCMFGEEILFITPSDLESDEPNRRFVTELGAENSRTVRKAAIFICYIGATNGKVQRVKVLSAFNQQLNAIEWNNDFNDLFGEWNMWFMKFLIIAKVRGSTTLLILNKGGFEKVEIIPPSRTSNSIYSNCRKNRISQILIPTKLVGARKFVWQLKPKGVQRRVNIKIM